MKRRGEGNWLAMALSVLLVCSLLTWPALAAAAGSGSDMPGSGTANHEEADEGAESAEEENTAEDTEGEEPEEEPEPTLEELRDELMAILGGGEEPRPSRRISTASSPWGTPTAPCGPIWRG